MDRISEIENYIVNREYEKAKERISVVFLKDKKAMQQLLVKITEIEAIEGHIRCLGMSLQNNYLDNKSYNDSINKINKDISKKCTNFIMLLKEKYNNLNIK